MFKYFNAYDRGLLKIGEKISALAEMVGRKHTQAMESLIDLDEEKAKNILNNDDEVDLLDEEIEMEALELISLQQPEYDDLRFLASAIRISHELERIADYSCDLAEITLLLAGQGPWFKPLIDISRMGEVVEAMMTKSVSAYLKKDLKAARELHDDDDEVDRLFLHLFEELTGYMKKDPKYVDQAGNLLLVTRYLERVGDHIVNISELTIFAETGERHPFKTRKTGIAE